MSSNVSEIICDISVHFPGQMKRKRFWRRHFGELYYNLSREPVRISLLLQFSLFSIDIGMAYFGLFEIPMK